MLACRVGVLTTFAGQLCFEVITCFDGTRSTMHSAANCQDARLPSETSKLPRGPILFSKFTVFCLQVASAAAISLRTGLCSFILVTLLPDAST
jgi:hypothetical protein